MKLIRLPDTEGIARFADTETIAQIEIVKPMLPKIDPAITAARDLFHAVMNYYGLYLECKMPPMLSSALLTLSAALQRRDHRELCSAMEKCTDAMMKIPVLLGYPGVLATYAETLRFLRYDAKVEG